MQLRYTNFTVTKKTPLTISRGTTAKNTNILLRLEEENIEGWGEASPFAITRANKKDVVSLVKEIETIAPKLEKYHPLERQKIRAILQQEQISSAVRAAIDTALYDWLGKKLGLPLWRLWGFDRDRIVPISVTVGISTPEAAKTRVRNWQKLLPAQIIKLKLGSPEGSEADRAMLLAVKKVAPEAVLVVDANGGWSLQEALQMCDWLAQQGVKYVEQPLPVEKEPDLVVLSQRSPLPIFVDESCFTSRDIPRLAHCVQGINIKLMKAGGLSEVMAMVQVARACGLQVMYGCYSDSTLANTAMSHLAPLADYLDLDSHLNLVDDPFTGAVLAAGRLLPNDLPGLGVKYASN